MPLNRVSQRLLLLVLALALGWLLFAQILVPPVIAHSYRGRSFSFLNSIITSQATHPLEDYLQKWNAITVRVLLGLLITGMMAGIVTHPTFQRYWEAGHAQGSPLLATTPMRRWRVALVYGLASVLIGGSLVDIVTDQEHWPLSNYPMYAKVREPTLRLRRLYGVTATTEIPLTIDRQLSPFTEARLLTVLKRLRKQPNGPLLLDMALQSCLERYEFLRRAYRHHGPPLVGLRLYELEWPLSSWAENRAQPRTRTLLHETRRKEK